MTQTHSLKPLPEPVGELTSGEIPHLIRNYPGFIGMAAQLGEQTPLFTFTVGGEPWVFLTDAELTNALGKRGSDGLTLGPYAESLVPVTGSGLPGNFTSTWRRQRLIVARSLSPRSVRLFTEAVAALTLERLPAWEVSGVINVHKEMLGVAFDSVAEALFAGDIGVARERFLALDEILLADFAAGYGEPGHAKGSTVGLDSALSELDAFLYDLIARRRAAADPEATDVLSRLVSAVDEDGQPLTDLEIRDEAVNLILAGHETTANTLTFAVSLLSRHPDELARLRDEVTAVLGTRVLTAGDVERLPRVRQVIDETLRLYPVADLHDRRASEDLNLAGYAVPAGTPILFTSWLAHHDASHYEAPEAFNPDRFDVDHRSDIPRHAYAPFGSGPRTCPGKHFALMEATAVLATIAQNVDVEPLDQAPPQLSRSANLMPLHPVRVRIRRRVDGPAD